MISCLYNANPYCIKNCEGKDQNGNCKLDQRYQKTLKKEGLLTKQIKEQIKQTKKDNKIKQNILKQMNKLTRTNK